MDIKQLRYFLSIADLESFNRAAATLRIAQPALTRQIQHLEAELGVKLLSRHARGVHLTAAGRLLRERAQETLRQIDQTRRDLTAAAIDAVGTLHLGMPPSLRHLVTAPLVAEFVRECPSVFLRLTEATSMVLNDATLAGNLDVAVVGHLEPTITPELAPLVREGLFLIGPAQSDLDPEECVDVDRLMEVPLILTSRPNTLRMIIENAMNKRGLSTNVVLETDCFTTVVDLMNAGLGFSIVPSSVCAGALRDGAIRGAPLKNLFVTWMLIQPRDQAVSVAVIRMRDLLRATIAAALAGSDWPHAHAWPVPYRGFQSRSKGESRGNSSRVVSLRSSVPTTNSVRAHEPSASSEDQKVSRTGDVQMAT